MFNFLYQGPDKFVQVAVLQSTTTPLSKLNRRLPEGVAAAGNPNWSGEMCEGSEDVENHHWWVEAPLFGSTA